MQQQIEKPCHPVKMSQPTLQPVACSLPNITSQLSSNNTRYTMLSRGQPSCTTSQHSSSRNSAMPVISQPAQPLWNGHQALNNQVAPGNRANNYWDNFRRYFINNSVLKITNSINKISF